MAAFYAIPVLDTLSVCRRCCKKNKIKEDANQRLQVTDRKCQRKILLIAATHDVCLEMFRTLCLVPPELPNAGTSLCKLGNYGNYGSGSTPPKISGLGHWPSGRQPKENAILSNRVFEPPSSPLFLEIWHV